MSDLLIHHGNRISHFVLLFMWILDSKYDLLLVFLCRDSHSRNSMTHTVAQITSIGVEDQAGPSKRRPHRFALLYE